MGLIITKGSSSKYTSKEMREKRKKSLSENICKLYVLHLEHLGKVAALRTLKELNLSGKKIGQ